MEAAEFNAALPQFGDTKVFGLSPDSVKSHVKFAASLGLNYSLLADEETSLLVPLGVWVEKSMYGKKYWGVQRSSFLVGEDGNILNTWIKVNASGHVEEVLAAL